MRTILLPGAILLAGLPCAARETAQPAPVASHALADPQIAALLDRIEDQVAHGHTTAPADDCAVESWSRVVQKTSPPSPAAAEALADFIGDAHRRASEAKRTGHDAVALDLLVFADLARDVLKEAPAAQASRPPGAAPAAHQRQAPATVAPQPAGATAAAPRHADVAAVKPATLPAAARTVAVAPRPVPPGKAGLFISRGDHLLAQKDISGARKFYEFAANAGSARGAAALAATYDPDELRRLGVIGLPPNPAQAIAWYRRAVAMGDAAAETRLRALQAKLGH